MKPLRIGIAGLGTVGSELVRLIERGQDLLQRRSGRAFRIVAVSARTRSRSRGIDISRYAWEPDPVNLARRGDIDLFVELIGGEDGPAKESVTAALMHGKHVVTANKAMLALHGQEIAELAESRGLALYFEAAVAGGIPVIRVLAESMAGNRIHRVMGVMNGTCNYILTRMEDSGNSYEEIFEEANSLGYLEADPNLDVGGIDAGHKLALLSSMAFGTRVDFSNIKIEGIQRISLADIEQARTMGFRVKLLGVASRTSEGLEQRMQPCLVPANSPLGQVDGATNMVVIEADSAGQIVLRGAGAGGGPTSSSVLADIAAVARGQILPVFGQPADSLVAERSMTMNSPASYYLRMSLKDEPGVLALVASALGDNGVSINRMRQYKHEGGAAPVLIVTHDTTRCRVDQALEVIRRGGVAEYDPVCIRIENV